MLHPLPLPLSSCLGCIPPLIGLPSLRFYAVASSLSLLSVCFCLCFIFYRDDVLCWLLSCPFSSVCFPCLSPISGLIWFGSIYLVTTAGFVADQSMDQLTGFCLLVTVASLRISMVIFFVHVHATPAKETGI